jgi:hypothetical protein
MRFAIMAAGALAASAVVLSGNTARADDEATPSGIEVGLRTGYAIPLGDAAGGGGSNTALSNALSGVIPIWIDAGYRLPSPNLYIGAFFQYGIAMAANSSGAQSDLMAGVNAHYHLMPDQTIDPWVGLGFGYEWFNLSQNGVSASLSGFQFANVQVGGDYKVMPNLGIGPFIMFSLGQYSNASVGSASGSINQTAMHEFLTFGIRGAYDINL